MLKNLAYKIITLMRTTSQGRRLHEWLVLSAFKNTLTVEHNGVKLQFCVPNEWARLRAETFSSKEPETLEWIDGLGVDPVLFDVGANLGLYSLYTALKHPTAMVFAFEPSVFNLELLARNIVLNGLQDRIILIPLALNQLSSTDTMRMSSTSWGGAMNTFGKEYGYDGEKLDQVFSYKMLSCSLDDLLEYFDIEQPNAIKMDVDGIEHLILKGGGSILKSQQLKTILIEVNDDFPEQKNGVRELLEKAGLKLKIKKHAEWMDKSETLASTFNQIWSRD